MHRISTSARQDFHQRLHGWYGHHGRRDLPWRNTRDAYAIYISEVMLQQTQVQTVLARFYTPFLTRFPSLQHLADAPREAVLKQWEGLGYYSRAANLHKAAQIAAPELPQDVEGLMALPGIGRNTAHAVAAFAYHKPVAVMEANVKRVLCRIFALETPVVQELWQRAEELLDRENPFDYNQAMMDIGAMVCTRRNPQCGICPAQEICQGQYAPERYPLPQVKKAVPQRRAVIIVWRDAQGRVYLRPRETAFLGGLYGFAEYPEKSRDVYFFNTRYELPVQGRKLGEVTQIYSHFRMDAQVWLIETGAPQGGQEEGWYKLSEISSLALSGIDHKILNLIA